MAHIYDQHDKAFGQVAAYVVLKDAGNGPERVATIALRFPKDGAGRLYAYVHWLGTEMVRGFAGGFGYDKGSAAVAAAARKAPEEDIQDRRDFLNALRADDGRGWMISLEKAGFTVLQAV